MKIVFLDAETVGDVDLSCLFALGDVVVYDTTSASEVIARSKNAEVLITNKVKLMESELSVLPDLKLICIAATGMNNVDLAFASKMGIKVANVVNYSTESVAQTTFAMLFSLLQKLSYYDDYVKSGLYSKSGIFTHHGMPFSELSGKQWGIIGLGNIGKRVAGIASAFGARVVYFSTSGINDSDICQRVGLEELLSGSDIVSIHAPLSDRTRQLITFREMQLMKPSSLLINVGRGGIVDESDISVALRLGYLSGAALDVYDAEPIAEDHPLLAPDISSKLCLTPHIAWASVEARQRLVQKICANIEAFIREQV